MDLPALGSNPNADELISAIYEMGLERHVLELEVYGFTVVPPERLGCRPGFIDALRDAICRVHAARNDEPIEDYTTAEVKKHGNNWWLLEEDDVFVEAVTNPVLLTLARWMCGQSAYLTGTASILKAPERSGDKDAGYLPLHNDTHGLPPPLGEVAHWLNTSWITTDYAGAEDGPTVLVPGSHRFGRVPQEHERKFWDEEPYYTPVPLVAEAGSLGVWHGATWHGSTPRTKPGLRVTLVLTWARNYMMPVNLFRHGISDELIDRFPELRRILAMDAMYPFDKDTAPQDKSRAMINAGNDPFG